MNPGSPCNSCCSSVRFSLSIFPFFHGEYASVRRETHPSASVACSIEFAANSSPRSHRNITGTPPNSPRSGSTVTAIRNAASTSACVGRSEIAHPTISLEN